MAILDIKVDFVGEIGTSPRIIRINTNDSLDRVTSANYLQSTMQQGFVFYPNDMACVTYGNNVTQFFTLSLSGGSITLVPEASNVQLPVIVDRIAVFKDTSGAIGDNAAVAANEGSIHAGINGVGGGSLASFSGVANSGGLYISGVANAGNFNVIINNASHGQSTTYTIPDAAASTAKIPVIPNALVNNNFIRATGTAGVLADAGARIISGTTSSWGGGAASNAFAVTGLTAACVGSCIIRTSANPVSIVKALPGTNTLTVTFSADPGAGTTVDYIYTTAAMT